MQISKNIVMRLGHALDKRGSHFFADLRGLGVVELEHGLDDGELGGGGVLAGEGAPVIDHHSGAYHVSAPVDSTGHKRNLVRVRFRNIISSLDP